jgi:prepilin-type N-terminal cleavage/methylation domain-containing protein
MKKIAHGTARGRLRFRGFSMMEILVALAIIALVLAVVVPMVARRLSDGEAGGVASTLDALRRGVLEYRADVRRYPTHLRYLSTAPGSAVDICNQTVPSSFLSGWRGPYVDRSIGTGGVNVSDMTVLDSIGRVAFTSSTTGDLAIRVDNVDSTVARRIERDQDATLDFAAGTIRWTQTSGTRGVLSLLVPARGC